MKQSLTISIVLLLSWAVNGWSHCEIPCGIYDDGLRIKLLKEHTGTISKSINKIKELEKEKLVNNNQLVRWINNKEVHAEKIQDIVHQYFMTQRIKFPDKKKPKEVKKYNLRLGALHEILVFAMKAKQNTDTKFTDKLLESIEKFESLYMGKHPH